MRGGSGPTIVLLHGYPNDWLANVLNVSRVNNRSLDKPVLVLAGERARGQVMIEEASRTWPQTRGVVLRGFGHYLPGEAPEEVTGLLRSVAP